MIRRLLTVLLLPSLAAVGLAGCSADGGSEGLEVVVTAYPMQFIAERVAGDLATVTSVAPAGTEPHDLELSPSGVASLTTADVVLMLSGFQSAVDDALGEVGSGTVVVDAADSADLLSTDEEHEHGDTAELEDDHSEHEHGDLDPHFWLDPARLADVADALADALAESDVDNASGYRENAASLRAELDTLIGEFDDGLATCTERSFVVSHEAFGYLADAFDLEQIGITGLEPEAEASPARVAEVLQEARDAGVTTVFTEPGGVVAGADAVAAELGVALATLDPIELAPTDGDYVTAMRANLAALHQGLACTT
jgi:zinc transport system substrate-binding protein